MDRIQPTLSQQGPAGASAALAKPESDHIDGQHQWPAGRGGEGPQQTPAITQEASRVLRNTYALLSLTLLFSAGAAATSVALALPVKVIRCGCGQRCRSACRAVLR